MRSLRNRATMAVKLLTCFLERAVMFVCTFLVPYSTVAFHSLVHSADSCYTLLVSFLRLSLFDALLLLLLVFDRPACFTPLFAKLFLSCLRFSPSVPS